MKQTLRNQLKSLYHRQRETDRVIKKLESLPQTLITKKLLVDATLLNLNNLALTHTVQAALYQLNLEE